MRAFLLCIVPILVVFGFTHQQYKHDDEAEMIDAWYLQHLSSLKKEIVTMRGLVNAGKDATSYQQQFKKMRLVYKQLAVITDYFNAYETMQLNGPALLRTEEDHPNNIIEPHGFQQLEDLIWNDDVLADDSTAINDELNYVDEIITGLQNEPDRIYKFKEARVWDALRMAVITIVSKGITGFDSPLAFHSLPEATATLQAIDDLANIYAYDAPTDTRPYYNNVAKLITDASRYISMHQDFNSFDRLLFIKQYMNPLSEALLVVLRKEGFRLPVERRPLNDTAINIFAADAFDVDFFSPNQRYQITSERIALGKQLFYDNKLSANNNRSCASCHQPALAFTDGLKTASALDNSHQLKRNTPTLLNAVFQTRQFYDSRKTMLEFQVASVVHNTDEMGGSLENAANVLKHDAHYISEFKKAYANDAQPVSIYTIANAIASYVRSLTSLHAKFDAYMRGENVSMTENEKHGFNLFAGKAKCATCHFIPLFNGLVPTQFNETESEVLGVPATTKKPAYLDSDSGKYYFTKSPVHLYAFKTPTVRNIALTAPYMHNGVYKTLEEVIDFYNDGGGKGLGIAPTNQSLPFDKLELSKREKKDIIAFLKTLTDTSSYKNSVQ